MNIIFFIVYYKFFFNIECFYLKLVWNVQRWAHLHGQHAWYKPHVSLLYRSHSNFKITPLNYLQKPLNKLNFHSYNLTSRNHNYHLNQWWKNSEELQFHSFSSSSFSFLCSSPHMEKLKRNHQLHKNWLTHMNCWKPLHLDLGTKWNQLLVKCRPNFFLPIWSKYF